MVLHRSVELAKVSREGDEVVRIAIEGREAENLVGLNDRCNFGLFQMHAGKVVSSDRDLRAAAGNGQLHIYRI